MKSEVLSRFYKVQGAVIAFYIVWILLLLLSFLLLMVLENRLIIIIIFVPALLISSILFSIYAYRKMKELAGRFEREK